MRLSGFSLKITGKDLDPNVISILLGSEPSEVIDEGTSVSWILDYPKTGENLIDDALKELVQNLKAPEDSRMLNSFQSDLMVSLWANINFFEQFTFPLAALQLLSKLKAGLIMDILISSRPLTEPCREIPIPREWLVIRGSHLYEKRFAAVDALKSMLRNEDYLKKVTPDNLLRVAIKPPSKRDYGKGSRLYLDLESLDILSTRQLGLKVATMPLTSLT